MKPSWDGYIQLIGFWTESCQTSFCMTFLSKSIVQCGHEVTKSRMHIKDLMFQLPMMYKYSIMTVTQNCWILSYVNHTFESLVNEQPIPIAVTPYHVGN